MRHRCAQRGATFRFGTRSPMHPRALQKSNDPRRVAGGLRGERRRLVGRTSIATRWQVFNKLLCAPRSHARRDRAAINRRSRTRSRRSPRLRERPPDRLLQSRSSGLNPLLRAPASRPMPRASHHAAHVDELAPVHNLSPWRSWCGQLSGKGRHEGVAAAVREGCSGADVPHTWPGLTGTQWRRTAPILRVRLT